MTREDIAGAFGRDLDPLGEHAGVFEGLDADPFEVYLEETGPRAGRTVENYRCSFRKWRRHMESEGRHPACPSAAHVRRYIEARADDGVQRSTIVAELKQLSAAHSYFQEDSAFPHPADFDPFAMGRRSADMPDREDADYPQVGIGDLRDAVAGAGHHLDRAVLVLQLKLGLRASELCNIRLPEVNPGRGELADFYGALGTHPEVEDRPGSLFVPSRDEREGNKSVRPRVLPLDDETRHALARYLLVRPANGSGHLLLSKRAKGQMSHKQVTRVWEGAMPGRLADPDDDAARPVRSHFGRHWFTTYWDVREDVNSELVAYMRGDAAGSRSVGSSQAMSHYLHVHYDDVEGLYRDRVFKLGL